MKLKLIKRKVFTLTIFWGIILFLIVSCSMQRKSTKVEEGKASMGIDESMVEQVVEDEDDIDEMPTPIGGDTYVLMKMKEKLRNVYHLFVGNRMRFSVEINKRGEVEKAFILYVPPNYSYTREIKDAIRKMEDTMRYIRFTPAIKNGKKVRAKFIYDIWL